MFSDAYLAIIGFMEMGGDVLWFIAGITFLMWSLIFERIWFSEPSIRRWCLKQAPSGKAEASASRGVPTKFERALYQMARHALRAASPSSKPALRCARFLGCWERLPE